MAYEKQTFLDEIKDENGNVTQEGTVLKAEHLNHMEEGIKSVELFPDVEIAKEGLNFTYDGEMCVAMIEHEVFSDLMLMQGCPFIIEWDGVKHNFTKHAIGLSNTFDLSENYMFGNLAMSEDNNIPFVGMLSSGGLFLVDLFATEDATHNIKVAVLCSEYQKSLKTPLCLNVGQNDEGVKMVYKPTIPGQDRELCSADEFLDAFLGNRKVVLLNGTQHIACIVAVNIVQVYETGAAVKYSYDDGVNDGVEYGTALLQPKPYPQA